MIQNPSHDLDKKYKWEESNFMRQLMLNHVKSGIKRYMVLKI